MNEKNPLTKLLVSESQPIDSAELAQLLGPYVGIHQETRSFDFSSSFMELKNDEKVLLILCAVKARSLLFDTVDRISPKEIIEFEIAPVGSIKATLKKLLDERGIASENRKYYLPNYKLPQIYSTFKS